MPEDTSKTPTARRAPRQDIDERALARALLRWLPVVTIVAASLGGAFGGLSLAILLLTGGTLLGVIALFWASLRVLSGEVELPPELASAEPSARGDALSARKKMLVRALKDLDNERALGRLEDDDYAQLSQSYRDELKVVLRAMDDALEPYRAKAEEAARRHLEGRAKAPKKAATTADDARIDDTNESSETSRIACASCQASNEPDARFCKGCGATLRLSSAAPDEASPDEASPDAALPDTPPPEAPSPDEASPDDRTVSS